MDEHGENNPKPSRRDVLKVITVAGLGAATGVGGAMMIGKFGPKPGGTWRYFTEAEAKLVEAISEQIVPADRDSGAKDARVVNFIDIQLVGPYQRFQEKYRAGLAGVQKTSQKMFGKDFGELAWAEQTKLLTAMETGKAPKDLWTAPSAGEFFNLIRDHTMQGYYGSPRHGGNRNAVSFRMMGLEYPRIIGQNRYRSGGNA